MLAKLKSLLGNYRFSNEELEIVLSHFEITALKRKDHFLKIEDDSHKMAFIEEGAFHNYIVNNEGEKITTFILLEGDIIASISSYLRGIPSSENIQAITDTNIAVIHKTSIDELRNTIPKFQQLYIDAIEKQITCLDNNRSDLLTMTPEQRYLALLKKQPLLFQKIPLKLLATTLGITPRHLTRIRKSILD